MRGFSSVASRASSPAFTNLSKQNQRSLRPITPKPSNLDSVATTSNPITQQSSPTKPKPSSHSNSNTSVAVKKVNFRATVIDHKYFSQILARKDWYLLLNHEYKAKRVTLNQQEVVSILQNQENPLHPFRFYIWL